MDMQIYNLNSSLPCIWFMNDNLRIILKQHVDSCRFSTSACSKKRKPKCRITKISTHNAIMAYHIFIFHGIFQIHIRVFHNFTFLVRTHQCPMKFKFSHSVKRQRYAEVIKCLNGIAAFIFIHRR